MKLSSIMTKELVTVDMDTTLCTMCEIFDEKRFHHLLVIEDDELRGVISDRDLLKALSPFLGKACEQNRDLATLRKRAHQVMSRKPVTITGQASSEDAAQLMLRENISCLPVMSSDGQVVGIITWKDLLRNYSQLVCVADRANT
ncbi:MAG: CBS domain-containing protein [Planctomycetes bacterium B3_Pla]|nr:MAG: CBS domain-containing protein [Planctomycetes bacterium B3_Pla]